MTAVRPVRGTHDLVSDPLRRHRHIVGTGREVASRYGYDGIDTPIFEFTEVFRRTLGEVSDVVTKEMYTFEDRGGDSLTLRPEGTAAVIRAIVSGNLAQTLPVKLFYAGPMFRYERPQKGRLRQFHQIGIELVGAAEPMADVETIALGAHVLDALGLRAKSLLEINSLGDQTSREAYRRELVAYFQAHRGRLSRDSVERLERNPMRILDSKDEADKEVVAEAPRLGEHLNEDSRRFYDEVLRGLRDLDIDYVDNPHLVRGLDYYNHTAFEFTTDALGAQSALLAGGRYDGLMKTMGGPDLPGVGWAAGVERLALLLGEPPAEPRPVTIVPIGEAAQKEASAIARELRYGGISVDLAFKGKPAQRMKRAHRVRAKVAMSIGEDELARGVVKLRDLDTGAEHEVARAEVLAQLRRLLVEDA